MNTQSLPQWLHRLIRWLYHAVVRLYRNGLLAIGVWAFRRLPFQQMPSRLLLRCLRRGWGNEEWAASEDFLQGIIQEAWKTTGPVLECGSGLSTLLLGLIGERVGWEVWTLEHDAWWVAHMRRMLQRFKVANVHLMHVPLRDYGDFHWYAVQPEAFPASFTLVICDGPPGNMPGGRQGLLPVMGSRLQPQVVILLDDTDRPAERTIAQQWAAQLRGTLSFEGVHKGYARIVSAE
ncbi:MAG: hypothetical protein Q9M35_01025 [Rhodothermus sp.]|nr:hypothetical protein [Rhodothermus sp.]